MTGPALIEDGYQRMTPIEHNKILAIGFGVFAAIFAFTFLLMMVVSLGVFATLGITFANDPANGPGAGIGIIGGVVAASFFPHLGANFFFSRGFVGGKGSEQRPKARDWGRMCAVRAAPVPAAGQAV